MRRVRRLAFRRKRCRKPRSGVRRVPSSPTLEGSFGRGSEPADEALDGQVFRARHRRRGARAGPSPADRGRDRRRASGRGGDGFQLVSGSQQTGCPPRSLRRGAPRSGRQLPGLRPGGVGSCRAPDGRRRGMPTRPSCSPPRAGGDASDLESPSPPLRPRALRGGSRR